MKNRLTVVIAIFTLFLLSCPQPDSPPKGNTNNNNDNDTNKTTIVFNNTGGLCAVTVYDDYRREPVHKIAEVPAGSSSAEIPWQQSDSYPFYFSYTITLNGINNFSITYIPDTGKDQAAVRIDADTTTKIVIPALEETLSGPDALLSAKSYIAIQNTSSYSFQLYRNNASITPDKAASAVVNAGERALYTINPGAASPYSLLVGAEFKSFAGTVEAFEAGHFYQFNFDGNSISLFSQIPVTVANMRPPEPDNTVPVVPAVPAAPSLTASDGAIAVRWTETQGAEHYEVYLGTNAVPPAAPVRMAVGTSTLLDGLVNKTVYSVWIKAVNSEGSSAFSPLAQARPWPLAEVPEAPARPQVVAGVYQLTVTWNASGGAASYEVYCATVDTPPTAPALAAAGTRAVLTGLESETLYYVWVRAVNKAGRSDYSPAEIGAPRAPTSPPVVPGKPVLTVGSRELGASWQPVEMASAYEVWTGTSSNSAEATKHGADIENGLTEATLTGLVNGTIYYVWVKAKNIAGTSGFSPVASAAPSAFAAPPLAPAAPVVTAGSRELAVNWQATEGAETYEVWAGTSNNPASAVKQGADTTALSVTVTNLINGTTYYVWIKAKNRTGTSGFSPAASATPSALAAPPAAPSAPTVTPGGSQLFVNWQAVEGAESYEVWAGTSSNPTDAAKHGADTTELSAVITGLTDETTYYVWIKAKNSRGASGFSPAASGTPFAMGLYKGETFASATKIGNQDLEQALSYISANALFGDNYFIVLGGDETIAPKTLAYSGKTVGITLMNKGPERTIQLASNGSLFTVNSAVTLTLETNVTLKGRTDNTASLVTIGSSGTFTMNGGTICGNTASYGGGVYVNSGGTFTMDGGEISGNTVSYDGGGGVYVGSGTFTMSGGEISGNTASYSSSYGGGVYVSSGTFTMSGGEISGNTASSYGGGVYVGGTFTMSGGEISGNTASSSSSFGGGVCVSNGTFTMGGGEISGNTASSYGGGVYVSGGTFTMDTGEINGNNASSGGGVYVNSSGGSAGSRRDSTFTMNHGKINGNNASGQGGGVYVYSYNTYGISTFTMNDGEISANIAGSYGGGVCLTNGTSVFTKSSIGGVITGYGSDMAAGNRVVSSSGIVQSSYGHAVYVSSSPVKRLEKTVAADKALDSRNSSGWTE